MQALNILRKVLDYGNSKGVDFSTIVQSYNFGSGYIDYVSSKGGKHTKELAKSFSVKEATVNGWTSYGDVDYVVHVMSKVRRPCRWRKQHKIFCTERY